MEKKHLIIPALVTALLSASASSYAQDRYQGDRDHGDRNGSSQRDHGDRNGYSQGDRGDRNGYSQGERERGDDRNRQYDRGDNRRDGYQARGGGGGRGNEGWGGDEHRWNGAGPEHSFRRGDRLPERYRNHQYVVNDYREHHLRPPPRGYHWVQTGGDYVLAAVATGLIADLIINH